MNLRVMISPSLLRPIGRPILPPPLLLSPSCLVLFHLTFILLLQIIISPFEPLELPGFPPNLLSPSHVSILCRPQIGGPLFVGGFGVFFVARSHGGLLLFYRGFGRTHAYASGLSFVGHLGNSGVASVCFVLDFGFYVRVFFFHSRALPFFLETFLLSPFQVLQHFLVSQNEVLLLSVSGLVPGSWLPFDHSLFLVNAVIFRTPEQVRFFQVAFFSPSFCPEFLLFKNIFLRLNVVPRFAFGF